MTDLRERLAGLDPERRRYTLETLASHLVAAGRTDRLHSLFDDAQWLHARYEGSGNVYDGYVLDLDLAWEDSLPDAFARCFRYALIRCSVNSLSGSLPPELVIRIVETGLWPAERALSVSGQVPEPERRARLLALLQRSGRLNDLQEARVRRAALAALAEIDEDKDLIGALQEWVPLLDESDSADLLALAERIRSGSRALALSQAVALLRGPERHPVIERALEEVSDVLAHDQPAVYGTLAPFLAGDLADRAVGQARALGDHYGAEALARLAAGMPDGPRADLFEESLQLLQGVDDKDRAFGLREAIEFFPAAQRPELAAWALEFARGLPPIDQDHDIPQIIAIRLAAPYLDPAGAEEALAIAREFPRIDYLVPTTVDVLVALAERLPAPKREAALREALHWATTQNGEPAEQTESDEDWANIHSVESLAALARVLPADDAAPLLARAVESALGLPERVGPSNQLRTPRADALVQLAPLLPPPLLERVLAEPPTIRDHMPQCLALARLAPSLREPLRATVLETAVRALAPIEDEDWRKQAIGTLAPLLPEGLMQLGLDAANGISWDLARGDALAELAPHVPDHLVDATFTAIRQVPFEPSASKALQALIPRLPESRLDEALDTAWGIDWEPGRTQCATAIAARLPERARGDVLRRALKLYESAGKDANDDALTALAAAADEELALKLWPLAVEHPSDFQAENLMTALAPQLPDEALVGLVDSLPALRMAQGLLEAVAPRLDGELLARTLGHLFALDAEADAAPLAKGIEALAPLLEPEQIDQALHAVRRIPDATWRWVVLQALAPRLTPAQLAQAETAALEIGEGAMRARALSALIPHLDEDARKRAVQEALTAARREGEEAWARAVALANLVPVLDGDLRAAVAGEALETAAPTRHWQRLSAYGALAGAATGSHWEAAVTELLTGVADAGERRKTLGELALPADPETLELARRLLITHARRLRTTRREELLTFIANVSLFRPEVVDVQAIEGLARNVIEICSDWEWV